VNEQSLADAENQPPLEERPQAKVEPGKKPFQRVAPRAVAQVTNLHVPKAAAAESAQPHQCP